VSFGLLMSTLCNKVLPALIWTYAALACYLALTGSLIAVGASASGSLTDINPVFSLNPVCYSFIADQTWPVFGREIPTWILSIVIHLLVVKFVVLGAGSMIAPGDSKEIRGLRIHSVLYSAALFFLVAMCIGPFFAGIFSSGSALVPSGMKVSDTLQIFHGRALFGLLFGLGIIVVPYLSSFAYNDLRRHRPDGTFKIKETFSGRPSGHLPFLCVLFIGSALAYCLGGWYSIGLTSFMAFASRSLPGVGTDFNPVSPYFLMYVFLAFTIWLTAYLLGWYSSSRKPVLSRGRTISLFFFVLGIILPTALFSILAESDRGIATGVWFLNPVAGVLSDIPAARMSGIHGAILLCIAVLLTIVTIPKVAKQIALNPDLRSEDRHDINETIPAV
jgi:hypothetical protein